MASQGPFHLVVTTFNRADYLTGLLASVAAMNPAPDCIIVVDNASTDNTADVVARAAAESAVPLIHHRLDTNLGGAGGFSHGVERALAEGAQWLWLMDDDVEVEPDALAAFGPWMEKYDAIVGRRYDANGKPFFWQHKFVDFLGIHLPVLGDVFAQSNAFPTNVGVFEGMLLHADAVRRVGLPDPRFFITWDDAIYGWLVSLQREVMYVNVFVLRKVRPQRQINLGIRHLNDSSDLSRYYVMRNRGLVSQYLREHGRFNRFGFGVGTALTAGKEFLRLVAVERTMRGTGRIWRGWRDSRPIMADAQWKPMPPLV
ncbi:glycosyltransferase [Specibacter cremeus]|uniref:glycosyltransferase n=1 Tax=Specibacter cremeus TaxID=1629051 RepID=UPI000F76F638|nr:glycosyltransferase [Specibacter cremeus]